MGKVYGARDWFIPDGFYHSESNGKFPSHEAICVLNTGAEDAQINITLYFEDRDKIEGFKAVCKAERTNHIRMDKLVSDSGQVVPKDVPYAIMVNSNVDVIIQYSRMDTSQSQMALMTTMGYQMK